MIRIINISGLVILLFFIIGCAHIPTSEYPPELEKKYTAPFDKTWDATLKTVEKYKGTIIAKDRSAESGIVTFTYNDKKKKNKIYLNIYLKSSPSLNTTIVYLKPRLKWGYFLEEIDKDFFDNLNIILEEK